MMLASGSLGLIGLALTNLACANILQACQAKEENHAPLEELVACYKRAALSLANGTADSTKSPEAHPKQETVGMESGATQHASAKPPEASTEKKPYVPDPKMGYCSINGILIKTTHSHHINSRIC